MTLPHEEACDFAPASGHDDDHLDHLDEHESRPTAKEWRWARQRAEEGFSARSIARLLDVDHSAVLREAKRERWRVSWGQKAARGAQTPISVVRETSSGDRPGEAREAPQIDAERPSERRAPTPKANDGWGPPESEGAARLWVCRRCGLVGYDPGRRSGQEWHTPELCDKRVAHLDKMLDDRPRPFDALTVPW